MFGVFFAFFRIFLKIEYALFIFHHLFEILNLESFRVSMAWRFWHLPSVMNLIGYGTDQEPAKVCRRGSEGEENQNENQSKFSTVDLWYHLMDFSWISDGSLMICFLIFFLCTGKQPYDPFPRSVEEIPWNDLSLRIPNPRTLLHLSTAGLAWRPQMGSCSRSQTLFTPRALPPWDTWDENKIKWLVENNFIWGPSPPNLSD